MSFLSFENSRAKGEPVTLYRFFYINNVEYLYTDAEREIVKDGYSGPFVPMPIQRGDVSSSGTLDKAGLEIRMPRRAAISEAFRTYPPNEVVNVIIRQMHKDDPSGEALVAWTGRVLGAAFEEDELVLSCEPISTSLRRAGLRRNYQLGCPHVLYGTQCTASKAAATTPDISVVSVTGSIVRLPPNWLPTGWAASGKTVDKFVGGMMVWDVPTASGTVESKRTILKVVSGLDVYLAGPPTGLVPGGTARMILGCNHQMTDCNVLHGNITNYGGQPWIPLKSPFGFTNNFY